MHHRELGCAGEGLLSNAFVELICDGVHLHPDLVKMVYEMKGAAKMVAVTDSLPAAGLADGHVVFAGMDVEVKNGTARTVDGTLAGSTLLLRDAVVNIVRFTGMPLEDAIRTATINPARVIGMESEVGSRGGGQAC
uniref:CAZy families CE9 protein n=1 Tax=uncultured Caldicellulosiruptor sp. TaxID=569407 RepID=A0A060BSY1_9FIRM|nr:CAZy families CE9 protein [uncultured Caldicellulosiruptor sp.]